jgi:hypothetical protein
MKIDNTQPDRLSILKFAGAISSEDLHQTSQARMATP